MDVRAGHKTASAIALTAALTAACGNDTNPHPAHDGGPGTVVDAAVDGSGGYPAHDQEPIHDGEPGPAKAHPDRLCWEACFIGPCAVQCGDGMIPTRNADGTAFHCTLDTGQCDDVDADAVVDAGTE